MTGHRQWSGPIREENRVRIRFATRPMGDRMVTGAHDDQRPDRRGQECGTARDR
ncbi:hypothetical protein AB0C93_01085 [Streptomyces sp. NPDC048518]|uniref:hypothetical protein n=1 Tax=Streptomyces sp. NPDC048518 TaxID=3155029 RepID=UPI0033EEF0FA